MSGRLTQRSALTTLALGAALILGAAGPASADTELGDSGEVGPHHLRDTLAHEGVTCLYHFDGTRYVITGMVVRPPFAKSPDVKPSRDPRNIDWRIRVRARDLPASGPWKTIKSPKSIQAKAYDDTPAPFVKRALTFSVDHKAELRVIIDLYWSNVGGNGILGELHHRVDHYKFGGDLAGAGSGLGSCHSRYSPS